MGYGATQTSGTAPIADTPQPTMVREGATYRTATNDSVFFASNYFNSTINQNPPVHIHQPDVRGEVESEEFAVKSGHRDPDDMNHPQAYFDGTARVAQEIHERYAPIQTRRHVGKGNYGAPVNYTHTGLSTDNHFTGTGIGPHGNTVSGHFQQGNMGGGIKQGLAATETKQRVRSYSRKIAM